MDEQDLSLRAYVVGFLKFAAVIVTLAILAAVLPVERLPAYVVWFYVRVYDWLQSLPAGLLALVLFTPGITVAGLALAQRDKAKQQS